MIIVAETFISKESCSNNIFLLVVKFQCSLEMHVTQFLSIIFNSCDWLNCEFVWLDEN